MLMPRRFKFRKMQKGRVSKLDATRSHSLSFGQFGIQVLEPGRIRAKQLEAVRVAINRKLRRMGKIWFRIFPDIPVTAKPLEVRMGKGKGNVEYWACRVRPKTVIVEFDCMSVEIAQQAYKSAAAKLGIKTKLCIK